MVRVADQVDVQLGGVPVQHHHVHMIPRLKALAPGTPASCQLQARMCKPLRPHLSTSVFHTALRFRRLFGGALRLSAEADASVSSQDPGSSGWKSSA